jgi:hypothetical protein
MEWSPKPATAEIVAQTQQVLREYAGYGPMTVRQIFYRLVGNHGYDKTERAYKRLAEYLVKARRAQMIDFGQIRDDGGTTEGGTAQFETIDEFLDDMSAWGSQYRLTRTLGQPYSIELWCEAEGMVPMLAQMVRPWGVAVTGTGGFSSVTVTHSFARRVLRRARPTILLHVGDFDPSGESIFESMCQDIGKFVAEGAGGRFNPSTGHTYLSDNDNGPDFRPVRVALTADQVEEYDLPTAPPKPSDSRSAKWAGETTQAEAMPPDLLQQVVRSAIRQHFDQDVLDDLLAREEAERELIGDRVSVAIDEIRRDIADETEDDR